MKKTKIVATIGPASWDEATLRALFAEGVNVCRLNFSHGDHKSHKETMDRIKSAGGNESARRPHAGHKGTGDSYRHL